MTRPQISSTYRGALGALTPLIGWWGRLEVQGRDLLPPDGPLLLAGNHDSFWDPLAVGTAGLPRRQICALAKAELWDVPGLAPVLEGMGQVPIRRGASDTTALSRAIEELREGVCIGVFPEGTRSGGRVLRARSGIGRLAQAVPEAAVMSCTVQGTLDIARLGRRPTIKVEFFAPAGGGLQPGEDLGAFSARLLAEIRERAPVP